MNLNGKAKRHIFLRPIVGILALVSLPIPLWADGPAWWTTRGVLNPSTPANDYAAVNQGQLKNIATAAVAEFDAKLPGGAGDTLHLLINHWAIPTPQTSDYSVVTLGQLKAIAKPFYERLISASVITSGFPWTGKETFANDYTPANIGQVKNLFNFDATVINY